MTEMCVVSLMTPRRGSASGAGWPATGPSAMFATQYGHALTLLSNDSGLPDTNAFDACAGSMRFARSRA